MTNRQFALLIKLISYSVYCILYAMLRFHNASLGQGEHVSTHEIEWTSPEQDYKEALGEDSMVVKS